MIMQDEATFKRVSQCTTGRVFVLRFKNSSRKFFYWMQEPKDDKDEEICKKVGKTPVLQLLIGHCCLGLISLATSLV